jgi:hypothetical protein
MRLPLDPPPGLNGADTVLAAAGAWGDCDKVGFRLRLPQVIGGWESLTADRLTGICRTVLPWADNSAILNMGFGTHPKLQVWQGGSGLVGRERKRNDSGRQAGA